MRIAVVGAAGRMGTLLVEAILATPGLELAACIVSPTSPRAGRPVAGGAIEYRPADAAINARCDVMVDFSTPAASLAMQRLCGSKPIPFVVGTTGFSPRHLEAMRDHARHRPIVLSDNFAPGYAQVLAAAAAIERALVGARTTRVEDIRLRPDLAASREGRFGIDAGPAPLSRPGVGAPPGDVIRLLLDAGGVEIALTHRVNALAAYAEGALAAAHRLVAARPARGLLSLDDLISSTSIKDDRQ